MAGVDPDLDLVRALQAGDDSALGELMSRHEKPLMGMLFRNLGNEAAARDVLQETFVRAYFNIAKFEPTAKFATWLWTIAINLCRDHVRSKAHLNELRTESLSGLGESAHPEPVSETEHPDSLAALREETEALRSLIAKLPHRLRNPLVLFAIEGRTQEECAEILNISPKAVETRVYRARKILLKEMKQFL